MKKYVLPLFVAMLACGCGTLGKLLEPPVQMQAVLACDNAWARVINARGKELIPYLDQIPQPVPMDGSPGSYMELTATIFSKADPTRRLGIAKRSVQIPSQQTSYCDGYGCSSGVQRDRRAQLETWVISQFDAQYDPNYVCIRPPNLQIP